jgi:UBA-like domain
MAETKEKIDQIIAFTSCLRETAQQMLELYEGNVEVLGKLTIDGGDGYTGD